MSIILRKNGAYMVDNNFTMIDRRVVVVCGFPGVGKSTLSDKSPLVINKVGRPGSIIPQWIVIDMESSGYDKSEFPDNYIARIEQYIELVHQRGTNIVLLCSSHKAVRDAMHKAGISFVCAYPDKSLKSEYIDRYLARKNHPMPLKVVLDNWDNWIDELIEEEADHLVLESGQYLSDVIGTTL